MNQKRAKGESELNQMWSFDESGCTAMNQGHPLILTAVIGLKLPNVDSENPGRTPPLLTGSAPDVPGFDWAIVAHDHHTHRRFALLEFGPVLRISQPCITKSGRLSE